jgi:diacylglycerol kinase family enzyme
MKATLIYNQNARSTDDHSVELLQDALQGAGYEPAYTPTEKEEDLDAVLSAAEGGLVVAAGGDGTMRAVARRLLGSNTPMAILPLGTANNIARNFNIAGDPLDLIAALANPFRCPFDVGKVETPWGTDYFLEALGAGFYADTLSAFGSNEEKSVLRAIGAFTRTLPNYQAKSFAMSLDGRDIGGDYLLVEVLNTTAFGPRLKVAPRADSGDGLFEIVRIRADAREGFLRYMASLVAEELDELPSVETSNGRRLELRWTDFPIHVDGTLYPPQSEEQAPTIDDPLIVAEVLPRALELWLPHDPAESQQG